MSVKRQVDTQYNKFILAPFLNSTDMSLSLEFTSKIRMVITILFTINLKPFSNVLHNACS